MKAKDHEKTYFLSLTLENIRCFGPAQTLDLRDPEGGPARWTVLLGDNGTGKTTILQSLAYAIPMPFNSGQDSRIEPVGWTGGFERVRWQEGLFHGKPRSHATDMAMGAWWYHENEPPPDARIRVGLSSGQPLTGTLIAPVTITGDLKFYPKGARMSQYMSEREGVSPKVAVNGFGYSAERRMGPSSLSEGMHSGVGVESLFFEDHVLINANSWILAADYAAKSTHDDTTAARNLEQVKAILITVLPDVEEIRIQGAERRSARVEFKTPFGWVQSHQLGLGYRALMAWIVDFASGLFERYPDSPNPLEEPAVVLIDEIDLHLHPQWQRKLMGYLSERFPNTQFIATAHSPLIVQAASDANIAVLRREDDHVVIDNDPEAVYGWRVDQILTSDLFGLPSSRPPQLDELLMRRKELMTQSELSEDDKREVEELNEKIDALPFGETEEERETWRLLHAFARARRPTE